MMRRRGVRVLFLLACIAAGAWWLIGTERTPENGVPAPLSQAPLGILPTFPPAGLAHEEFPFERGDRRGTIHIYLLAAGEFHPKVVYSETPRFVSDWGGGKQRVVVNGGFFHEDYSPSGYLVARGG